MDAFAFGKLQVKRKHGVNEMVFTVGFYRNLADGRLQFRQHIPSFVQGTVLQADLHDIRKMPDVMAQYFQLFLSGMHIPGLCLHGGHLQCQDVSMVCEHLVLVLPQDALVHEEVDDQD